MSLETTHTTDATERPPLVGEEHGDRMRVRWSEIQTRFVDDPRIAVAEADALVEDVIDAIRTRFERQRSGLERRWHEGEEVSTEDLRHVLQDYRDLFSQLLDVR